MSCLRFVFFILVISSLTMFAFAQPMQYSINNVPGEYGGMMLAMTCGGLAPIPDGEATVFIYQDIDGNGPTDNDPLIPVCDHPENECEGGPIGTFNFNSFPINGQATIGEAGYFVSENYLTSYGNMPVGQPRFYLRVRASLCHSDIEWVSDIKVAGIGGLGDWYFSGWRCLLRSVGCMPTEDLYINPDPSVGPQNQTFCINLCPNYTNSLYVGPLPQQDRIPHITITPGCPGYNDPCLIPAENLIFNPAAWVWYTAPSGLHYYRNTVTVYMAGPGGVVTVNFDNILPVEMGTFAVEPLDHAVRVTWNTVSETDLQRFDLYRDGARIGSKPAVNSATGATYVYRDDEVVNGATYSYGLVAVNLDGSSENVGTASATPRAGTVTEYALYQNYPNPFNPTTSIAFDLAEAGTVSLAVFNLAGQKVADLVSGEMPAGNHIVPFDAANLPSGVYVCRLNAGDFSATRKMLLMK
jgi:hypothetical protein